MVEQLSALLPHSQKVLEAVYWTSLSMNRFFLDLMASLP